MEVVRMARMVPMGMERWASFRSPERLEPAMIPEEDYHKTALILSRRGSPATSGNQDQSWSYKSLPVTEGKKMPTSSVKEVVMSANT